MTDTSLSIGTTYYLGGPDLKGGRLPALNATKAALELEAGAATKLRLNGEVTFNYYSDYRQFQLLNPQFPLLTTRENEQNTGLIQGRLSEAQVIFYGERTSFFLGYQQAVFGKTEFPLAPANAFAGTDFSAANQIPTYRPVPALRGDVFLGSDTALFFVAAPSSETRNIMPFQIERLKASLPVGSIDFVNQGRTLDADALLGLRSSWSAGSAEEPEAGSKTSLLLTVSREHDHFFKLGGGALDPLNDSATLNGIYPSRETAATEVAGTRGNLVFWLQGNFSYYDRARSGQLASPLGDIPLDHPRYSYQGALGLRANFPKHYAYLAAQGFYGSLTGNGELKQAVASVSGVIQLLNNDLMVSALANSYFESRQPKLESFFNITYQMIPGLEVSLGGRLAQMGIFSLGQPWYGYLGLQYKN